MMMFILVIDAYLNSLPLLVKKVLQGYEAVYDVLKLFLGLLHGRLFPESAAAAQQAQLQPSGTWRFSQGGKTACWHRNKLKIAAGCQPELSIMSEDLRNMRTCAKYAKKSPSKCTPDRLRPLPPGLPNKLIAMMAQRIEQGAIFYPGVLLPEGVCACSQLLEARTLSKVVSCFL